MLRSLVAGLLILGAGLRLAGHERLQPRAPEPLQPAGIPGALVLAGGPEVPDAVLERFVNLANAAKPIVVLAPTMASPVAQRLARLTADRKGEPVALLPLQGPAALKPEDLVNQLNLAGALWLERVDDFLLARALADRRDDVLKKLLARGGALGASSSTLPWLGHSIQDRKADRTKGYGLFPDAIVRPVKDHSDIQEGPRLLRSFPGLVGYDIDSQAALVVQGRTLSVAGPGKVAIHLPAGEGRAARSLLLEGKQLEDLTALRRSARARADAPFPPKVGPDPLVAKGTLVIVGGGGTPAGLMKRFVDLAGGPRAAIVVLPTANPDPLPKKNGLLDVLRQAGAGKVTELRGRSRAEVESKEYLAAFAEATGVWFGGGRQWRFVDAYENTQAHALMKDVLRRGGVIGGSSAGATIQGDYLCRGGVFNNFAISYEGYERGLGFLPGTAIDQHFSQRKRFADMAALMKVHPQLLGIGIDETTALIVQGSVAEVVGKGQAFFYDARRQPPAGQPDYEALPAGRKYDLKARRPLAPGQ